jgi:hypothetical protein
MMASRARRRAGAACAALALAGCGNDPARTGDFGVLSAFTGQVASQVGLQDDTPTAAAASPAEIAAILPQLPPGPVIRFELPTIDQSAIAFRAGSNAGTVTLTTVTGQTVTLRGGVIVATRGFVYDLMSTDLAGTAGRVAARQPGPGRRANRYLDGLDAEVPLPLDCALASEGAETVTLVTGARVATTRMRETCTSGALTFNNFYWVAPGGTVVRARQWISREVGELHYDLLRG